MKTRLTILLTALVSTVSLTSCYAQSYSYGGAQDRVRERGVSVEATSSDISYNLDLRAVASVFADSRDLEEFERRINDYDESINNLDLNQDGQVDYLRVIEAEKGNSKLVVLQAVLDRDIFQDVASIVVERRWNSRTYVQIVGDPFLYGPYYIIEPVYVYTPSIFSFFWGPRYYRWHSPYYWGYYPSYFHYYHPRPMHMYVTNINVYVDKHRNTYRYSDRIRSEHYNDMRREVSRTDYERRNPSQSFSNRVGNSGKVSNRRDLGDLNNQGRVSSNSGRMNNSSDSRGTTRYGSENGSRTTRNSEEWKSGRQSGTQENGTRVNRNTNSESSRTNSSDDVYTRPSRNSSSGTTSQPTRNSAGSSDSYSRPSRNSNNTSGTYTQPSRGSSNSSSNSGSYTQPSRNSGSSPSSTQPTRSSNSSGSSNSGSYSQPSRNSGSVSNTQPSRSSSSSSENYSQPSRSSSSSSESGRSSSSSSSSPSRSSSDNGGGRSGGRR